MKEKGFTLVELLAVIVILAILMVSAGTGVMTVMNNSKMNTFKNEVSTFMNAAGTIYSEVSMTPSLYKYIHKSEDSTHGAVCVSLAGLVANGVIEKNISGYAGVFLVEVPFDSGVSHTTAWVHNSTYGINGIGKEYINKLKFKKGNNTINVTNEGAGGLSNATDVNGGAVGIVTKLDGIKTMIGRVYPSKASTGMPSNIEATKIVNNIKTYKNRGGTGLNYINIECINSKL